MDLDLDIDSGLKCQDKNILKQKTKNTGNDIIQLNAPFCLLQLYIHSKSFFFIISLTPVILVNSITLASCSDNPYLLSSLKICNFLPKNNSDDLSAFIAFGITKSPTSSDIKFIAKTKAIEDTALAYGNQLKASIAIKIYRLLFSDSGKGSRKSSDQF
ncbi:hypothetical protein BB561_006715 [Smittium simulii]|uniref:Uncharacterized protein n=1 Tax=Smittium simulii TaxID=133385 RepID=A0A2T9Y240_9FUNG|nr:hypothetical protein BB561_006715 [Smittium simulii]